MSATKSLQAVQIVDADGNPVGIVLDGAVYRLQSVGKVLNAGGSQINPATQETLSAIAAQLPATLGQKPMVTSSPVTIASDQVPPLNSTVSDTIVALDGTVTATVQGWSSCMVILSGTWVGKVVFEVSSDGGATWIPGAFVTPPAVLSPLPVPLLNLSGNGTYQGVGLGAVTNVRVRASEYTSGTISVQLVFSSATPGLFGAFSAIQQNVAVSVFNNSETPLDAFETFTGLGESTLGVVGIQVNIFTDQTSVPEGLKVQQSNDNINWDIEDARSIPAGIGRGITFQATASYFRVVYQNGPIAQTVFRLQSVLCPIASVLPRSLGPKLSEDALAVTIASDQEPVRVQAEPNADSMVLFGSKATLSCMLVELQRIRTLLEIMSDESVPEIEIGDDH